MLKPIAQSEIERAAKDFGCSVEVAEIVARATDRAIENTIVDLFKQAGVLLTEHDGEIFMEPWPLSESPATLDELSITSAAPSEAPAAPESTPPLLMVNITKEQVAKILGIRVESVPEYPWFVPDDWRLSLSSDGTFEGLSRIQSEWLKAALTSAAPCEAPEVPESTPPPSQPQPPDPPQKA